MYLLYYSAQALPASGLAEKPTWSRLRSALPFRRTVDVFDGKKRRTKFDQ